MKVLVISHNALSTYNNMGKTLYSLLGGIEKEKICQLYVYPTLPDVDCCTSYYRISDVDVLKSYYKFRVSGKKINKIVPKETNEISEDRFKNIYLKRREKKTIEMYLRDFIWKNANWFNKDLKRWLDNEKPTCIFVAPGKYNFFYKIALKCQEYLNVPIVTYICDDFYFTNNTGISLSKKIYNQKLRKNIDLLLNKSSHLITISNEMKTEYSKIYEGPTTVVMTGTSNKQLRKEEVNEIKKEILSLTYMGNIGFGRYLSLCDIGNALDTYNKEKNKNIKIKIYTSNQDIEKITELKKYKSIELCGYVTGKKYNEIFNSSDVLVHVEGMSQENIDSVKYSISTKIADILNSNISFFAYGPKEVSSIKYLNENNAAIIANEKKELIDKLQNLIEDEEIRNKTIINGIKLVNTNHNTQKNQNTIKKIIEEAEKKKKVMQINCVYRNGSTGKIVYDIHSNLRKDGHQSIVCYGRKKRVKELGVYKTANDIYSKFNNILSRITGLAYGGCLYSTSKLIKIIKKENPNVIHLHCLNSHFVNIYWLINWLKNNGKKTILTLHAEFMYTANCSHSFECKKWKEGCKQCPQPKKATKSIIFNNTELSWKKMNNAFNKFEDITIISVSPWLMNRAKQSPFLGKFNNKVIYNGIDTDIFKEYENFDLIQKHKLENKKIIFHATPYFNNDIKNIKGGYYIIKLAELAKNDNIQFIVAGQYDRNIKTPSNIILLGNINDQQLLAKYYSLADLTIIASKRETFSMVTIESLCCGTPVLGFKAGAPEEIALKEFSQFVEYGNINELYNQMLKMLETKTKRISKEAHQVYGKDEMYKNYKKLYER